MAELEDLLTEFKLLRQDLSKSNTASSSASSSSGSRGMGFGDASKALGGFAKQVNAGGGRLSGVTDNLGKLSTKLAPLSAAIGTLGAGLGYLEETTDVFRALSKVGGGAAGSLGALRSQAGQANLSLEAFSNIVLQNSQQLVAFGGGLENGQRKVASLGQALFDTGTIDKFMALGMSIEEANEFVVKNTALQSRQAMLEGMNSAQQVNAAAALAKNMTIMAKLTGKDIKQMQDDLMSRQRDGSTQAALRLMEMDGVTNAGETFASVNTALQGGSEQLRNLFKDYTQAQAPLTESTQNYAAVNQEAAELAMKARQAMAAGNKAQAEKFAQAAVAAEQEFATSRQGLTIATYGQISDIAKGQADVLEETGDIITGIQASAKNLGIATDEAGGHLKAFSTVLANVNEQVTNQQFGKGPGQAALKMINTGEKALAETAGDINQTIGTQIDSNSKLVGAFNGVTNNIGKITEPLAKTADNIVQGLPGSTSDQVGELQAKVGDETETGYTITQEDVGHLQTALNPLADMNKRIQAAKILSDKGIVNSDGNLRTSLMGVDTSVINTDTVNSQDQITKTETETGQKTSILDKLMSKFPNMGFADGGTLGAGMLGIVGEGGGMQNAELLSGPATVTPMTTMANALQTQFSTMASQMQNVMKQDATGVPQALQDVMADLKAVAPKTDDVDTSQMSTQMSAMKKQMQEIQNSPDLIQMMQQLIEINRKTMENTNKQFKLSSDNMRGI